MYDSDIEDRTIQIYKAIRYKNYDNLEVLLKNQVYINTVSNFLILKYAILQDDYITLMKFIDRGFDINIIDSYGYTLLRYGVEYNRIRVSKLLLENGSRISPDDYILLFTAMNNRSIEMMDLLILHGIKINVIDTEGYSALYYAVRSNDSKLVSFLLSKGIDIRTVNKYSLLHYLVTSRNAIYTLITLLDYGADVNFINHFKAPIHMALEYDNTIAVLALITRKADINIQDLLKGLTPLHYSIRHRNYEATVILIDNGADVNKKDRNGNSPLFYAAKINDIRFTRLLLENGANLEVFNIIGKTPIEIAINNECLDVIEYIMKYFIYKKKGISNENT